MGTKESVDHAHELHFEFGGQEAFKALFDYCILREIENIVNVDPGMEGLVYGCGRGIFRPQHTFEEGQIMKTGLKANHNKDGVDQLVPVTR